MSSKICIIVKRLLLRNPIHSVSRGLSPEISEASDDLLFFRVRIYTFHSGGDIVFQHLRTIVVVLCNGEEASTMTSGI